LKTDKIYLVGFMGAGKTTVARALGERLSWPVRDIDELIEARERATVAEIFSRRGEAYFRSIERQLLLELVPPRHLVVATGGGTFADPENRVVINRDGVSIWLDVAFEQVLERLPPDGRRPLAADRVAMEELFVQRRAAYRLAHLRLDSSRAPVGELLERILDWLGW